jgi:hypothetical protein
MALERMSAAASYLETLERVLDKGIVIDAKPQPVRIPPSKPRR